MYNTDKFKERVKERCKATGVTQKYLCDAVGKGKQYLNNIWDGKCGVSEEELSIFADRLSTTPEYLSGITDDPVCDDARMRLSPEEEELVELYRGVSPEKRELFKKIIEQMKG